MRNLLLSVALIALPVGVFAAVETVIPHPPAEAAAMSPGLGDLGRYRTIVSDTQKIAATGDFKAAETRVTDFETLWDKEQDKLRPMDKAAWGHVDDAADAAFKALRTAQPKAAKVDAALTGLQSALKDGGAVAATGSGGVVTVAGIAITDETGHALPCEAMLKSLKAAAQGAKPADAAAIAADQAKGTERCNADDDRHADEFFARGIALAKG